MSRKRNSQSFCLILLLFAETIQGLTPDLASVASTRLLQMIEPTSSAEGRGQSASWMVATVPCAPRQRLHPTSSVPFAGHRARRGLPRVVHHGSPACRRCSRRSSQTGALHLRTRQPTDSIRLAHLGGILPLRREASFADPLTLPHDLLNLRPDHLSLSVNRFHAPAVSRFFPWRESPRGLPPGSSGRDSSRFNSVTFQRLVLVLGVAERRRRSAPPAAGSFRFSIAGRQV